MRQDAGWSAGRGSRGGILLAGAAAGLGIALAFLAALAALGRAGAGIATPDPGGSPAADAADWRHYGGDAGGARYSSLDLIHRGNVSRLTVAWTYRTGDASHDDGSEGEREGCGRCHTGASKFEATPIHVGGRLFLSTPLNRVLALDAATGKEIWRHDPAMRLDVERAEGLVSRGVAYWEEASRPEAACGRRILFGTLDARLLALDAETGEPCVGFGEAGAVRLDRGVGRVEEGEYGVTSPPVVAGDVVVVGSSIGDNRRVDLELGIVRGYDARTGDLRWSWDPIPRDPSDPAFRDWSPAAARRTGGANAWAPLSMDADRDLVFVPTGSAAPDFYGGERPGTNRYANSVVALRASTGEPAWTFQVVHHDLWDYDVPAQLSLVDVPRDGRDVPAVAVPTKAGHLFFLDRGSGQPLFPVEERPVPASDVPGESASPTQPFPVLPPPLHPRRMGPEDAWGATPQEREACRAQIAALRNDGLYTPPSLRGTLMYPGFGGGMTWGGLAFDPRRRLVVVNVLRLAMWVRLAPRPERSSPGNMAGTPYTMSRAPLVSPSGLPCSPPPWGTLAAVDLATGALRWEVPLGVVPALADAPGAAAWGSPNMGGPIVTAGGLVFIGAAMDDRLRAFDVETGEEVWTGELPAGGQATPMTYLAGGRQYVVIAAGGHGNLGTTFGDWVVAFALP